MRDSGSLIEQEDHDRALGRAYDDADQLDTLRAMRRDRDFDTLRAMEKFGGQFVRSLAHTARCADITNYERLRNAFSHLWTRYADEHVRRVEQKYE